MLQVRHRVALWYCCHECKPGNDAALDSGRNAGQKRKEIWGKGRKKTKSFLKSVLKESMTWCGFWKKFSPRSKFRSYWIFFKTPLGHVLTGGFQPLDLWDETADWLWSIVPCKKNQSNVGKGAVVAGLPASQVTNKFVTSVTSQFILSYALHPLPLITNTNQG